MCTPYDVSCNESIIINRRMYINYNSARRHELSGCVRAHTMPGLNARRCVANHRMVQPKICDYYSMLIV